MVARVTLTQPRRLQITGRSVTNSTACSTWSTYCVFVFVIAQGLPGLQTGALRTRCRCLIVSLCLSQDTTALIACELRYCSDVLCCSVRVPYIKWTCWLNMALRELKVRSLKCIKQNHDFIGRFRGYIFWSFAFRETHMLRTGCWGRLWT
jgi:hypothetical protein